MLGSHLANNLDGFITIPDKRAVKFAVNTGTRKITRKRQMDKIRYLVKLVKYAV